MPRKLIRLSAFIATLVWPGKDTPITSAAFAESYRKPLHIKLPGANGKPRKRPNAIAYISIDDARRARELFEIRHGKIADKRDTTARPSGQGIGA